MCMQGEYVRYSGGEYEELDDFKEVEADGSGLCLRALCLLLIPSIVHYTSLPVKRWFPFLIVELAITSSHRNTFLVLRNLVQPPLRLHSFVLRLLWCDLSYRNFVPTAISERSQSPSKCFVPNELNCLSRSLGQFCFIYLLCVDARQITVLIFPPTASLTPSCALLILPFALPIVSRIPPPLRT